MTPRSHAAVEENPTTGTEHRPFDQDVAVITAGRLVVRDEFVIDLRFDGRVESYLRQSAATPAAGSPALRFVRRALDIGTALAALIITTPLFVVVAVCSKLFDEGAVFFTQERVGRGGKLFRCYKFRTMHADAAERLDELLSTNGDFRSQWERDQKVPNDPRITRIGGFLRKTSLDELPQLMNVLKGDMSIIGPRPIVPEETIRYGDAMPTVLSVRPGITGLWQVSGRNALPYPERVQLDLRYIDEQSLKLDSIVLLKTVATVATGRGAS